MRKKLTVIGIVLLLVLALSLATSLANQRISEDLFLRLRQVESDVQAERWPQAQEDTAALRARWEAILPWLQIWINHGDTDAVTREIQDLAVVLANGDRPEGLRVLVQLRESIHHLCHRDALSLSNLF